MLDLKLPFEQLELILETVATLLLLLERTRKSHNFVTDLPKGIMQLIAQLQFLINVTTLCMCRFMAQAFPNFRTSCVLKHWQHTVLDDFGSELGRYLI